MKMNQKSSWTTDSSQIFYNWIGERYDWFSRFEAHAKTRALELLGMESGDSLLSIGIGTGKDLAVMAYSQGLDGFYVGIDNSERMLQVSRQYNLYNLVLSDALNLPFCSQSFDKIYCSYVLDLLPIEQIPGLMKQIYHLLRSNGKMVFLSLTEGVSPPSRLLVSFWKRAYMMNPKVCGGCLPVNLRSLADQVGLPILHHEIIVQLAVPSEILVIQ
jgi:demethylmenaquinone methyltransferase/2-methoxy-6-polyprenyl-1,4-benzoquinol methylase